MAKRIDDLTIQRINELYLHYGTYAAVAREIGCAASTVKKYIIPNFSKKEEIIQSGMTIPSIHDFDMSTFMNLQRWNALIVLSDEEKEDLEELRKEVRL